MDAKYISGLIKGKITEVIFEEMFKEATYYTVIPNGYEYTNPELAQYQHLIKMPKVLENIRSAPDFVLISQDKKNIYFVEVKYRHRIENTDILEIAEKLVLHWDPCLVFVASPTGFYYSPCHKIINNEGKIDPLPSDFIPTLIQDDYLAQLNEFIKLSIVKGKIPSLSRIQKSYSIDS